MSLSTDKFIIFIKEKRIFLKTLFSLSILISLFISAIIITNTNYSPKVSDIDGKNSFEIISISNKPKKINPDVCDTTN